MQLDGRHVYLHRLVMLAHDGEDDPARAAPAAGLRVDHRNGVPLDCRAANLRWATSSQNAAHRPPPSGRGSGFKGVRRSGRTGRWIAIIKTGGRTRWLGSFGTAREAALAYDRAAVAAWADFAWTNYLPDGTRRRRPRSTHVRPPTARHRPA